MKPPPRKTKKPKGKGPKTVPYENVVIPMADKSVIDKILSWRCDPETKKEELLVKYKVIIYIALK